MSKQGAGNDKGRERPCATLVCPSCFTRYKCDEVEPVGKARLCDYCHVPLVREEQNRQKFRCFDCTRRILTPEGVWCTYLGCVPTADDALTCTKFSARAGRTKKRHPR